MMILKSLMAYFIVIAVIIAGGLSLLLFGFFMFGSNLSLISLGYDTSMLLAWDFFLCLLFFVQHSGMIRIGFRHRLGAIVPSDYHGAIYTIASAAALFALVFFWQHSELSLFSFDGWSRLIIQGVFLAALTGILWSVHTLHSFDIFGIQPLCSHVSTAGAQSGTLIIRGPYRWIRHPMYLFVLLMIWACPDISVDRLLFNILFSAWIVIGTILEERDLVEEFGQTYTDYQREVPMLIPGLRCNAMV